MAKYVKKPVVIEAYQTDKEMIIHTLEGDMKASVSDYIITGVHGEQYPCKPDIFGETYKPVEDESKGGTHEHVWPRKIVH
nr:MAG TPA: PGDYG protein [Caudoviricetes sp.]